MGVEACPTPVEELVVPVQVKRDNVHVNNHWDLPSEWLKEPQYGIEDNWKQVDEYMGIDDVKTSSSGKQNHPDYLPPETNLQAHQPVTNKEQLWNMYPECFDGIGKFKDF